MSGIWLHQLPHFFDKWKLDWDPYPGWETRARRGGAYGYASVRAIQTHNTVSKTSLANDARYCWENASTRPIGAVLLGRDGKVLLGCAGPTNTSGRGGPRLTSNGVIPLDAGNTNIFAIEACNDGNGEPWPDKQQIEYLRLCCAVKDCLDSTLGQNPIGWGDIHAHREWAPTRKVDPRGPSHWSFPGSLVWDMDKFRYDCAVTWLGMFAPTPTPDPDPTPVPPPPISAKESLMYVLFKNSAGGFFFGRLGDYSCHVANDNLKDAVVGPGNPGVDLSTGRVVQSWGDVNVMNEAEAKRLCGSYRGSLS